MLASLAEYERELITERVNAGVVAKAAGTRFGRPPVNPNVIAEKLKIVNTERATGGNPTDAAHLIGWSRVTFYRHHQGATPLGLQKAPFDDCRGTIVRMDQGPT